MKGVILAAGVGSRLGSPLPKTLSILPSGERILGRQIRIMQEMGIQEIHVVVGFKKTLIMEEFPQVLFRYNPIYYLTNTSKSLLCALRDMNDDVIWSNGDVIFDKEVIHKIISEPSSSVAVNKKKCGEEEIKYTTDNSGYIIEISKQVINGEGEAVGVNFVKKDNLIDLVNTLEHCKDNDYFEKALQILAPKKIFKAVDISAYRCIEVDFEIDLIEARRLFANSQE